MSDTWSSYAVYTEMWMSSLPTVFTMKAVTISKPIYAMACLTIMSLEWVMGTNETEDIQL